MDIGEFNGNLGDPNNIPNVEIPDYTYEELGKWMEAIYEEKSYDGEIIEHQSPQDWNPKNRENFISDLSSFDREIIDYLVKDKGLENDFELFDWYWHKAACKLEQGLAEARNAKEVYFENSNTARKRYYIHTAILKDIFVNHNIGEQLFADHKEAVILVSRLLSRRAIYPFSFFVHPDNYAFGFLFNKEIIQELNQDLSSFRGGNDFVKKSIEAGKKYVIQEYDFIKRYLALKDVLEHIIDKPSEDEKLIQKFKVDEFTERESQHQLNKKENDDTGNTENIIKHNQDEKDQNFVKVLLNPDHKYSYYQSIYHKSPNVTWKDAHKELRKILVDKLELKKEDIDKHVHEDYRSFHSAFHKYYQNNTSS